MFKKLIEKLLCLHQWKRHDKKIYGWTETKIDDKTQFWINPVLTTSKFEKTIEILICEKCGKIHKIEY